MVSMIWVTSYYLYAKKKTGLRILNGCHNLGNDKDYKSVDPKGMSVVNYVIHVTTWDVFLKIKQFIVTNFTDHAHL